MKRKFHITDHAVLRYLERVKGVDIEAARAEISRTLSVGDDHEGLSAVTSNGHRYVLRGRTLVTIKPAASVCRRELGE